MYGSYRGLIYTISLVNRLLTLCVHLNSIFLFKPYLLYLDIHYVYIKIDINTIIKVVKLDFIYLLNT
ncbi:hypothetical protein MOUN0_F05578 [Monosporozyma unispora]